MKISIITAVYNNEKTIGDALSSIFAQTYNNVEKVLIDGASSDSTFSILKKHALSTDILNSESDKGIYDALNKGLKLSSGDVIGLLHSDDLFADEEVVSKIANIFIHNSDIDAVYGDLVYVDKRKTGKVIRYWRAGSFSSSKLTNGWMPPHPTLYLRRSVYEKHGGFDTQYHIAADYDFMLRVLSDESLKIHYLPEVIVKMRTGGASNRSLKNIIHKSFEDYRALRANKIGGAWSLIMKNISKIPQFFTR